MRKKYGSFSFSHILCEDRCKKDKFPRWAAGIIVGGVLILVIIVVVVLYAVKRKGYLRSWFVEL